MRELISAFWRRYSEFKIAVTNDDNDLVKRLDQELMHSIDQIIHYPAVEIDEILLQFSFATDLIDVEAEDVSCVVRNIDIIRKLVDKYMGIAQAHQVNGPSVIRPGVLPYPVFDQDHWDDQSVAILVVKADYTLAYANPEALKVLDKSVQTALGRHVAEFTGFQCFRTELKTRIDECLKGTIVRFTHTEEIGGQIWVKIYDLSPCYSPTQHMVGAMMKLSIIPDRRGSRSAS